ncbi:MAG TPA: hypothetical protein VKU41_25405 [Polyangiaceae bacterium]|nr:hypothetical protein [Polyangiaceae bacterium]
MDAEIGSYQSESLDDAPVVSPTQRRPSARAPHRGRAGLAAVLTTLVAALAAPAASANGGYPVLTQKIGPNRNSWNEYETSLVAANLQKGTTTFTTSTRSSFRRVPASSWDSSSTSPA